MGHHYSSATPTGPGATVQRLMFITPERLAYLGLLGAPQTRMLGAVAVYASIGQPFTLTQGSSVGKYMLAVMDPYAPHRISSPDEVVVQILAEAETVQAARFKADILRGDTTATITKLLDGFRRVGHHAESTSSFDSLFFAFNSAQRNLDSRIAKVTRQIIHDPAQKHGADKYAHAVGLSLSRFTHLFRGETGTTLRQFRAWKRARGVMPFVTSGDNLLETALSAGYADSTHFSHSIRHFFGLKPRDIFAGSRNMSLVLHDVASFGSTVGAARAAVAC